MRITTTKQYKNIIYSLRTYRLMYNAGQSATYLAAYNELLFRLYDTRVNGQFLVFELSTPSVTSLTIDNDTFTETVVVMPMVA